METIVNPGKRIASIDLLRGVIMIIMALDHTRDFFHDQALITNPLDPLTTTPALFFTRWITHLCAPAFVFLSGMSAWLQGQRKTKKELGLFLVTRGLWLIIVDLLIMSLLLTADIHYGLLVLETLWSIGAGMVILGLLIRLPFPVLLSIGLIIVFGHNLIDYLEADREGKVPVWWNLLHRVAVVPVTDERSLLILYPFLPWTGLMLLGYCCGRLFTDMEERKRSWLLLSLGIGLLAFFILLRYSNLYGDPSKWVEQPTNWQTLFSFMNVQKYPPSLLFLCATIGPSLIFLALVKKTSSRLSKIISVYGQVPLFYFIVHFAILHVAQIIVYLSNGHSVAEGMMGVPGPPFKFANPGEGFSLGVVYVIWLAIVLLMYPLCKKYSWYKLQNKNKWWLSYL